MTAVYDDDTRALNDPYDFDDPGGLDVDVDALDSLDDDLLVLPEPADQMHRLITLIAVLGLFGVCFATWSTTVQVPFTGAIAMAGFAASLALTIGAIVAKTQRTLKRLDLAVLAV